jgi:hypothetical protein
LAIILDSRSRHRAVSARRVPIFRSSNGLILCLFVLVSLLPAPPARAGERGRWDFDDPLRPAPASAGCDLRLAGTQQAVEGPTRDDGAVSIGPGSFFVLRHSLRPARGSKAVNEYSLLFDFRVPQVRDYSCFFQTNPGNSDDGECFVQKGTGAIGVMATGYSAAVVRPGTWYRLVVAVSNGSRYDIYLDGRKILEGKPQPADGRFSLGTNLLICADDNGEDNRMDLARVSLFDHALSDAEAEALNGPGGRKGSPFLTPPYLQTIRTDGVTVMWELRGIEVCSLEYGQTPAYGMKAECLSADSAGRTRIYRARLTGLKPGSEAHYRVVAGGITNADRPFRTAPDAPRDFTFGVWSDSQGGGWEPTASLMRQMSSNVDFAVSCGDVAEDGNSYDSVAASFLGRVPAILGPASVPFYVAWGNHCEYGRAVAKDFTDQPGPGNFSFDYGQCHFVCLDDATRYDFGWIENDLRAAAGGGAEFIFLFVHRPPYCELWVDGDARLRERLVPLIDRYGVDAVFSGHTHEYERGFLDGTWYCVTGGGSWLDVGEPLVRDWKHMTRGGYRDLARGIAHGLVNEYVRVRVGSTGWTAVMSAFSPDGTPLPEVSDVFSGRKKKRR